MSSTTYRIDTGLQFCAVARMIGIGDEAVIDPRTELTYAVGRRTCALCTARDACRDALAKPHATIGDLKPSCPNLSLLQELLYRRLTRDSVSTGLQ